MTPTYNWCWYNKFCCIWCFTFKLFSRITSWSSRLKDFKFRYEPLKNTVSYHSLWRYSLHEHLNKFSKRNAIEVISLDMHKVFLLSLSLASWSDPFFCYNTVQRILRLKLSGLKLYMKPKSIPQFCLSEVWASVDCGFFWFLREYFKFQHNHIFDLIDVPPFNQFCVHEIFKFFNI